MFKNGRIMFNNENLGKYIENALESVAEFIEDEDLFNFERKINPKIKYYTKTVDGKVYMVIPMPGVLKENIKIYFENGLMIVEAKAKPWYTTLDYKCKYQLVDCDQNSILAEYKNGMLELTINKTANKKTIEVK